ncbi:MAG: proline dehydrogenase family protein [Bernardetiaceae bacterium]
MEPVAATQISFEDTATAFAHRSETDLRKMHFIFSIINQPLLNGAGTKLANLALDWHLPFAETAIRYTVFEQFCGGVSIRDSEESIQQLSRYNIGSILDYSVEGEKNESGFQKTMQEILRTIDHAADRPEIPFAVFKVTGVAPFALLEKKQAGKALSAAEQTQWQAVKERMHTLGERAYTRGVRLFVDAEETWIQDVIDELVYDLMRHYNQTQAIIYNTYQLYTRAGLDKLKRAYKDAVKDQYFVGAKLVRGAYMEKERERAQRMGYADPIQPSKKATDDTFDAALKFCIEKKQRIALCAGSHNEYSNYYLAVLMEKYNIAPNDPDVYFAQLYGMSDHISFNLSKAGYNVAKYLPYGPVRSVMPYLIRRAQENTSVKGQSSREFALIQKEIERRKKQK